MAPENFNETPEQTLVSFAKMVLASAGYRVSNYDNVLDYSAFFGSEGPQSRLRKPYGARERTRLEAWAECADDWIKRFAPEVDIALAREIANPRPPARGDSNRGYTPMIKVKAPPIMDIEEMAS